MSREQWQKILPVLEAHDTAGFGPWDHRIASTLRKQSMLMQAALAQLQESLRAQESGWERLRLAMRGFQR